MWVETTKKLQTLTFNLMVGNDFVVPDPSTNAVLTVTSNRSGSIFILRRSLTQQAAD